MTARRILAAVLVAGLSAAAAVVGIAPAASAATPSAAIVVAPDGGGVLRSGKDLGFTVTVTNTSGSALAAGRLSVSLDPAPVASTSALLASIAKPPEALQGYATKTTAQVPELAPGALSTQHLKVAADELAATVTSASGARRLYVQYAPRGAAAVIGVTAVTQMAKDAPSIGLSTVIPITAPPGTTGIVPVDQQRDLSGTDGAWSRALRAAQADPAADVALDPEVLASIRLAGESAPIEARDLLQRLAALPNRFLRLPYADADGNLERAAGVRGPLDPTSFAGVTVVTGSTRPTPGPTATAGPSSRTVADLTGWAWSDEGFDWPVPGTTGSADLAAAGNDRVLLASDDVRDSPARQQAGPLARIGDTKVLVSDSTTSSLLARASQDTFEGAASLADLTGVLATAAVARETAGLLTTVGRNGDTAALDRALRLLVGQRWVHAVGIGDLGDPGTAARIGLRQQSVPASEVSTARSLLAGERQVRELGSAVVSGADTVTAPQRLALLGALSAAWRGQQSWPSAASAVEQGFTDEIKKVSIPKGAESNAIGTDGRLSVVVRNDLAVPVRVVVKPSVSNGRLQFPGRSGVTVTVPAQASSSGRLAFRSITNGTTDVTLTLETPSREQIGPAVTRTVTVRAGFDTIVAIVLLSALGLLLALGVYRNVKRRRQPRSAVAE